MLNLFNFLSRKRKVTMAEDAPVDDASKSQRLVREEASAAVIEQLPTELLVPILALANNPAAFSVSKTFHEAQQEFMREAYNAQKLVYRPLFSQDAAGKNEAVIEQQKEVDFLLNKKDEILSATGSAETIKALFVQLERHRTIQPHELRRFLHREKILDNLNAAIIEAKIRESQENDDSDDEDDIIFLDCSNQNLTRFPGKIIRKYATFFNTVTTVDLRINKLQSLPPEIGQLSVLEELYLNNNLLQTLPPEIGRLSALKRLTLDSNKLQSLPREIGQLSALQGLCLDNNLLQSLPPEIGQLSALQVLDLCINNLQELPREIGQLSALQRLDLDDNYLKSLPPEIGQLLALERFDLDNNYLQSLPPEIEQLSALQELYLGDSHPQSLQNDLSKNILHELTGVERVEMIRKIIKTPLFASQKQQFRTIGEESMREAYNAHKLAYRPLFSQDAVGKNEAVIEQQKEVDFLLNKKDEILDAPGSTETIQALFVQLERHRTIQPHELRRFLHREKILDNLNAAIIEARIRYSQENDEDDSIVLVLDCSNLNLTRFPGKIIRKHETFFNTVTTVDLRINKLQSLPPEIGQLSVLEELYLNNNLLQTLPPEIGQLSALQKLDLEDNKLQSLPPEIGQLSALQKLKLHFNVYLQSLPSEIGQLLALQELDLRSCEFKSLPPEIGQLLVLRVLFLSCCYLQSLPSEIGQLSALQRLFLDNNYLESLPPEIGQLSALQELDLEGNKLQSLPSEIGQLSALQKLSLRLNYDLESLPPGIGQLSALQELDLRINKLQSLPPEIGQLSALERLALDSNKLQSLPPEIGQLSALEGLYLNNNLLQTLPPEIGQLSVLRGLCLNNNLLQRLPPEIVRLSALQWLYLDNNQLESLPPGIGQLSALQELCLDNNLLQRLSPEIVRLSALKRLHLGSNELQRLPDDLSENILYEKRGNIYKITKAQLLASQKKQSMIMQVDSLLTEAVKIVNEDLYAPDETICWKYNGYKLAYRPLFSRDAAGKNEAVIEQQEEVDLLLGKKAEILKATGSAGTVAALFMELARYCTIRPNELRKFLYREKILDSLNAAIIGVQMRRLLRRRGVSIVLDCSSQNLTRFPEEIIRKYKTFFQTVDICLTDNYLQGLPDDLIFLRKDILYGQAEGEFYGVTKAQLLPSQKQLAEAEERDETKIKKRSFCATR